MLHLWTALRELTAYMEALTRVLTGIALVAGFFELLFWLGIWLAVHTDADDPHRV
jgi:hypothetical protein